MAEKFQRKSIDMDKEKPFKPLHDNAFTDSGVPKLQTKESRNLDAVPTLSLQKCEVVIPSEGKFSVGFSDGFVKDSQGFVKIPIDRFSGEKYFGNNAKAFVCRFFDVRNPDDLIVAGISQTPDGKIYSARFDSKGWLIQDVTNA